MRSMAENNVKTIEENMMRLEEINKLMNNASIKLDESFKLYKEGVELVEICKKQLIGVEKEMEILED